MERCFFFQNKIIHEAQTVSIHLAAKNSSCQFLHHLQVITLMFSTHWVLYMNEWLQVLLFAYLSSSLRYYSSTVSHQSPGVLSLREGITFYVYLCLNQSMKSYFISSLVWFKSPVTQMSFDQYYPEMRFLNIYPGTCSVQFNLSMHLCIL